MATATFKTQAIQLMHRNGDTVEVLHPLTIGVDTEEVGDMFVVRGTDGLEFHAFDDELSDRTPETASAATVVGASYRDRRFTLPGVIAFMVGQGDLSPAALDMDPEDVLDQHAGACAIDRSKPDTFDFDDFPKLLTEAEVGIADHAWLGREYWTFKADGREAFTAEGALQEWTDTVERDSDEGEGEQTTEGAALLGLLRSVSVLAIADSEKLARLQVESVVRGLNLEAFGCELPVRHN